ncbi:MAG: hypothetical protein PHW24_03745 [Candidatus Moranbacteria bacterium]|nr:hypothetical protein [Candidatus Moranbacteria bacterium]
MFGKFNIFNKGILKEQNGRPNGIDLSVSAEPMRPLTIKNLDELPKEESKLAEPVLLGAKDLGSAATRNIPPAEKKRRNELAKKGFNKIFNTQEAIYKDLSDEDRKKIKEELNEFLKELKGSSDAVDVITPDYVEDNMKKHFLSQLNKLSLSVEAEDYIRKSCNENKNNQDKTAWVEFLNKDENKNWESIFRKAKDKIIYPGKTKAEYEHDNPTIMLNDSFSFDLGEKIDIYLRYADDDVEPFRVDDEILFRQVLAAATAAITSKLPLQSVVLGGITYGIVEPKVKNTTKVLKNKPTASTKIETDAEKEEKTKFSRAGAEITLARIENYEDLNAPTLKEGDEKFLAKTKELWKEFAVHGVINKEGNLNTETDLDGKCCIALLKQAGFDVSNLKYVAQGATEKGYINMDTGGKDGVVVERNIKDDGVVEWEKTAHIDHHAKESKSGSSASFYMYKMLVDMGLLQDSPQLSRMVQFVTREDSGENPGVKKYFENSWKTVAGLQRFMSKENLIKFFTEDSDPNPTRVLSEEDLKKYGFVGGKDANGSDIDRTKQQEAVAKLSKIRLEQMKKNGFIVFSERYGDIAVSVENVMEKRMGKKNVPGDFMAAKAFGCDTLVIWNQKDNRFKISSSRLITDEFSKGFKVREKMWITSADDDSKLAFTLEEVLKKMTDGKFVPTGKLKEYIETGAMIDNEKSEKVVKDKKTDSKGVETIAPEKPKEKEVEELFEEAKNESFGILTVDLFQNLKTDYMEIAKQHNLGEKEVMEQLKKDVEKALHRNTKKEGKEFEKVVQYILDQLK